MLHGFIAGQTAILPSAPGSYRKKFSHKLFPPVKIIIISKTATSAISPIAPILSPVIPSIFLLIYPAKHYVTAEDKREQAMSQIRIDLEDRLKLLRDSGKQLEAYRLQQRTNYDLEMIQEIGYCKGIENYSRYFDGRLPNETPYTLMDFFPKDYLLVIDESHITVPQVRGMYNGDRARKNVLVDYGFRLPSAVDNRPLTFAEFNKKVGQVVYVAHIH